jgi:hypothetical protein
MKIKNTEWLEEKIQDIKKRKRALHKLIDPNMKKQIRKDLKREYRASKRSEKNNLREWIKEEINKNKQ